MSWRALSIKAETASWLSNRALIRLSGEDVRGFLQGLITNDVLGPLPVWAGLLTPQGKALFDFLVWADGGDILIDCEAAQVEALAKRLSLYRLRRPIVIAIDPNAGVHWSLDETQGSADPRVGTMGRRWIGDKVGRVADTAYLAHRLSCGIVEGAAELGQDKTLWLECNAREQHGVSFTKGCYIGQENTARMHHRSKVNRRMAVVAADSAPKDARAWYPDLKLAVVVQRLKKTQFVNFYQKSP
jgi:tRNA-modifying protein YgfZ